MCIRLVLGRAVSILLLMLTVTATPAADIKPNVILINCDDLGYGDLGCYGAKDIRTPQLDRMASEGTRYLPFAASPKFKGQSSRGLYGDVVEELDDSVGQILDTLENLGLAEKTLVRFTSDKGPERNTTGTAAPLRGTKHTIFEGGLRVPCVACWPGHVPASRVCDEFISTLDVFPTVARLVNAPLPVDGTIDGYDVSSVLLGVRDSRSPRNTLYSLYGYKQNRHESFREGRWKLHLTTSPELYDLAADIGESSDIAKQHPELIERLTQSARQAREETRASPEGK